MSVKEIIKTMPKGLKHKIWLKVLLGVGIFTLGVAGGVLLSTYVVLSKPVTINAVRDPIPGYGFIDPILYTESPEELSFPRYMPLENALQQYVSTAEKANKISAIGIYYRDLNSSEWLGINQDQKFDAASMMKVVTLIALLRASEVRPDIMSVKVSIPSSVVIPTTGTQDYYPPVNPIKSGNSYTIPDLMQELITQSDNGADAVLVDYLGSSAMATVYNDLHLPAPATSTGISPQTYSHLFRVLYNSSYLTLPDSEEALKLLSQTNFTAGLVAGVPSGTTVAHKFGESMDAPGAPGLNDCGIVYYPGHPYFLCVMTKGTDFNTLAGVIQDISRITWQQVDTLAKTNST